MITCGEINKSKMRNEPILSFEEFEYQAMLGSTNDAFVWGVGHMQWKPCFQLSPDSKTYSGPYAPVLDSGSLYLHPKMELTLNEDETDYHNSIAEEIKKALTDGKTFWDFGTNRLYPISPDRDVSVTFDNEGKINISASMHDGDSIRHVTSKISFEELQYLISQEPSQYSFVLPNPETGFKPDWKKGSDFYIIPNKPE